MLFRSSGTSITLTAGGGFAGRTGLYAVPVSRGEDIAGEPGQDSMLTASDAREQGGTFAAGDDRGQDGMPTASDIREQGGTFAASARGQDGTLTASDAREQDSIHAKIPSCVSFIDLSREPKLTGLSRCVMAKQYAGISNHKGETSGIFICKGHPECVQAVITPGRMEKRQNGRRIKGPGEPGFTLTCQDRHGILLCCMGEGSGVPFCRRIRRLTPRECWRLQAFDDFLFDRAKAAGVSDAQLYRQAGNAVTVNVVYAIGLKMAEGGVEDEV